jgi:hypothetical protein
MPDTHVGYGVPVGSVIVTDGTIIQGGSPLHALLSRRAFDGLLRGEAERAWIVSGHVLLRDRALLGDTPVLTLRAWRKRKRRRARSPVGSITF